MPEFNKFLQTHRGKILMVTFIGIQFPLIILICSIALLAPVHPEGSLYKLSGLIVINAIAVGVTLTALYRLLVPILFSADVLGQYLQNNRINHLPIDFNCNVSTLVTDTDQALQRLNEVIQHLTNYDTLTGLPNRSLFKSLVRQTIERIGQEQQFAIIVLDLSGLKDINSTLGREIGNMLLVNIAQRLTTRLEPQDILARFGGSDFVVLRSDIRDHDSLIDLSRYLLDSFAKPFVISDRAISCSAKIGITIYPLDGVTVEQLLQNADTAIYQANQQNSSAYQFYSPSMTGRLKRTLAIKENLRYALIRNELYLHYQPRIEIATGRLAGVEALLRWHSPELGAVSPEEFIPIAEATNLIVPIGEWVLQSACEQNKQWQELGVDPFKMSVNLSTRQFKQIDLIETIDRILNNTGLDCSYLELEVTESLLVEDFDAAISLLDRIKRREISIALDDFGTGYSSLRYLQRLPID
ncbi:MAG: EAL domain-containing protein, partial [Cyanobacteria bacterium J06600_6]